METFEKRLKDFLRKDWGVVVTTMILAVVALTFIGAPRAISEMIGFTRAAFADGSYPSDPKWLIPVICKAGGVTKRELGAIVIEDEVTRFEISAAAAGDFAAAIERPGAVEKGMRISADFSPEAGPDVGRGAPKRKPRAEGAPKWTEKPKTEGAGAGKPAYRKKSAPEGGPGGKPRSKPEGKFGGKPFATKGPRSKA